MLPLYHATGAPVHNQPIRFLSLFCRRKKLLTSGYFSHMMHFDETILDLHGFLKKLTE
jgi:hypothetical protein